MIKKEKQVVIWKQPVKLDIFPDNINNIAIDIQYVCFINFLIEGKKNSKSIPESRSCSFK